jgi:glutathionylspermidine synthase
MKDPWLPVEPLGDEDFARLRRRAIFDCCKWDPQVGDTSTIARFPIVLTAAAWDELTTLAQSLARETLAAEAEIASRPELHRRLGLPGAVLTALEEGPPPRGIARLIRFDFHATQDGWRISEANTDVPGGLNEASGLPGLMNAHVRGATTTGDAAGAYARALADALPDAAHIALAHATAYTDDRQVMTYVGRRLAEFGVRTSLVSPAQLRWRQGRAFVDTEWTTGPVDAVVRFFPGEWLPNLPASSGWRAFFHGARTPASNPATALLTQTKRFPLLWDVLRTPLPTWRSLLPETRDPRDLRSLADGAWVLKPALGRVGEDIALFGVTSAKDATRIARAAARHPAHWIAQRRFVPLALRVDAQEMFPCFGVYTVDDRVCGVYGRVGRRPLIDGQAMDVAIMAAGDDVAGERASTSTLTPPMTLDRSA